MTMIRPYRELDQFLEAFDSIWGRAANVDAPALVPLDIFERDNHLVVRASIPGVKPEDVEVAVERDVLTIRGEMKSEWESSDAKVYRRESRQGRFARSIRLPEGYSVEQADAAFEHGVVTVRIPKKEQESPDVRRIPLRTSSDAPAIES